MPQKRKSRSSRPRTILDGRDVCDVCHNPKKHKPWCYNKWLSSCQSGRIAEERMDDYVEQAEGEIEENMGEEVEESTENVLEPSVETFLKEYWSHFKATLPPINKFMKKEGVLNRDVWPTWRFVTPDPYMDEMVTPNNLALRIGSLTVYVWCPHTSGYQVKCVNCGGSSNIQLHGWSGFRQLMGLSDSCFLITRRYRHVKCPVALETGKSSSVFTALDARYMSTLPPVVQAQMDFIIKKKSAFKSEFITYAREMQQCCSFENASSVHRALIASKKVRLEHKYLLAVLALRNPGE